MNTSALAYERIKPHVPSILEQVYAHILAQGLRGATALELEAALGVKGSTIRPRLITLRGLDDKANPTPARIITMGEVRGGALAWMAVGVK